MRFIFLPDIKIEKTDLIIPKKMKEFPQEEADAYAWREELVTKNGIFGYPSLETVNGLLKFIERRKVYDIGCGVGYFSYCLKYCNEAIDVVSIDNFICNYRASHKSLENYYYWTDIVKEDWFDNISNVKNSVVLMCWPDINHNFAAKTAKLLDKSNELIYIGELKNGSTAEDEFFDNNTLIPMDIPWYSFPERSDKVYLVKR